MTKLGQLIRARRRELDMTQAQLSEASGLGVPHICQIEKGKSNPSVEALRELATALQVPVGYFMDAIDMKLAHLPKLGNIDMRDWFAGLAMQAAATNQKGADGFTFDERAAWAYLQADAMLKARAA